MKKILYIVLGGLLLAGCSDFLKEESNSEVIPRTTGDMSELLLGEGYPSGNGAGDNTPDFSTTQFMDDDRELYTSYFNPSDPYLSPDYYVGEISTVQVFPFYTWQPTAFEQDGNGLLINQNAGATVYAGFYKKILGCNAVLDRIDDARGMQEERDMVKAEALALRAFYYFWLVNLYGEPYNYAGGAGHGKESLAVPVKLNSDLSLEERPQETVGYIYDKIIVPDLLAAIKLMEPLTVMENNYRINHQTLHILLSRVYLYMGEWTKCAEQVDKAEEYGLQLFDMVANRTAGTPISFGGEFWISYDNPEVVWLYGRAPVSDNSGYMFGQSADFQALWPTSVSPATDSDAGYDFRYSKTYGFNLEPDNTSSNVVTLNNPRSTAGLGMAVRASEAYLNRAEASALAGNETQALTDYNLLRKNRIKGYVDESYTGDALVAAIREERRRELCYEGHRWFDLRRQGMPQITHKWKNTKGGAVMTYTLERNDPFYTLPFPRSVVENNNRIRQNASGNMPARAGV